MKLLLIAIGALVVASTATAATPRATPEAAIMRQAENSYVEQLDGYTQLRDLVSVRCRTKNKSAFICTATVQRGAGGPADQSQFFTIRLLAKVRKAGGFCWAVVPAPVPSGCLAPGKRAEGSLDDISEAVWAQAFSHVRTLVEFRAIPHGSGFFSWTWREGEVHHRGTVVFSPTPKVKVLA